MTNMLQKNWVLAFFILILIAASVKNRYSESLALYKSGDVKKAREIWQDLVKKKQKKILPELYFLLAKTEDDYFNAIVTYKRIIKQYPDFKRNDEVLMKLADLYYLHSNYTEALRMYTTLCERFPSSKYSIEANYWLGNISLNKKKYKKALTYYNRVIESKEYSEIVPWAYLGIGYVHYELEDFENAIQAYKKTKELFPYNEILVNVHLGLADSYFKVKRYKNAYIEYRNVIGKYSDSPQALIAGNQIRLVRSRIPFIVKKLESDSEPGQARFSVQVGSFKNKSFANALRLKLKKNGFDGFMVQFKDKNGRTMYKTLSGKLKERHEALGLKEKIKKKLNLDCLIIELEE